MRPILHDADERLFNHNGVGVLSDATYCIVSETLNGGYELEMRYPIEGIHFEHIKNRMIILAKPNRTDQLQPFRVYRITKPIMGIVTVYAEHISYDLAGIPVDPFTAVNAVDAMEKIHENSAIENPFTFISEKETEADMSIIEPRSAKACLLGQSGSLIDTYAGELHYDCYTVKFLPKRGEDNGVRIVYGKNLTDLRQEENNANVCTGIYPYATDIDGRVWTLPEKIIRAEGDFGYEKIKTRDFSADFEDGTVTESALREKATNYIKNNDIGKPSVSIHIAFAHLADTEEYKNIAFLEDVALGDTVSVLFPKMGVSSSARCVQTVFNVLTDKYEKITLGKVTKKISDDLIDIPSREEMKKNEIAQESKLMAAIKRATELLNGANGGVFEILDENGDGINDAWVIRSYDSQKFIKATRDGIGITLDGGKTYITAITNEGINAEAITVGKIDAEQIDAKDLVINAGQVRGTLSASQINVEELTAQIMTAERALTFIAEADTISVKTLLVNTLLNMNNQNIQNVNDVLINGDIQGYSYKILRNGSHEFTGGGSLRGNWDIDGYISKTTFDNTLKNYALLSEARTIADEVASEKVGTLDHWATEQINDIKKRLDALEG